jgi:RNA 3'-terminal phosphate cyclase (ATP)
MTTPLFIDGSSGEGGGQILRTSLALSVITGRPFRIFNIRANRPKGGLRRQHLTCVLAAAAISGAQVTGAAVDSRDVTFTPAACGARAGDYAFDVGSAGSTMLVLQTVLPALMLAKGPSTLLLEGGTHNFGAPPLPFLEETFLPQIRRMGVKVDLALERAGFAPAGGGRVLVAIQPGDSLRRIELFERGPLLRRLVRAIVAGLSPEIASREIAAVGQLLELKNREWDIEELPADQGPGNLVNIHLESTNVTEVITAFGQKGLSAERVGRSAAEEAVRYLASDVPVGEHLADQLLLPMALAGGGAYVTGPLSLHAITNVDTIRKFLDIPIEVRETGTNRFEVRIGE